MEINQKKLQRQLSAIEKWVKQGAKGTFEAVTGFGKSYLAVLAIKRLKKKYPHSVINIVVPGTDLSNQWKAIVNKHGITNTKVWVINTYIRYQHECDLLVLDEIHNYAADEFSKVFEQTTYRLILGLTATLERIDGRHEMLSEKAPIFDSVSLDEAKREGYVSNFNTFNWGLDLTEEEQEKYNVIHSIFNSTYAYFQHNFEMAMVCSNGVNALGKIGDTWKTGGEWRLLFAHANGWDETEGHFYSPANVSKKAQQWRRAMMDRKKFIYTAQVKVDAIRQLVEKFPCKTMVFSENSEFADRVEKELGSEICRAYHTNLATIETTERVETFLKNGSVKVSYKKRKLGKDKLKKMILSSFMERDGINVIATVRALDEGYDNDQVKMAIMASYSSSKRQDTQRSGRAIRKTEELKTSLLINLYINGTQEEKWLKQKQAGKQGIAWVDSIHEITREEDAGFEI